MCGKGQAPKEHESAPFEELRPKRFEDWAETRKRKIRGGQRREGLRVVLGGEQSRCGFELGDVGWRKGDDPVVATDQIFAEPGWGTQVGGNVFESREVFDHGGPG